MTTLIKQLSLLLIFAYCLASAQTQSEKHENDSINTAALANFNKKVILIKKQISEDSIQKIALEAKIKSLKTTDNLIKETLQKQLNVLVSKDSLRLLDKKKQIDALRSSAKYYAVNGFFNDTLFVIYSKLGSFSAQDRAIAIERRIKKLADNFYFKSDSINIIATETTIDLMAGENILISLSDNDAIWNNTTKLALANEYKIIIVNAIISYKKETSFATLAKEIGLAILVLIIIVGIFFYIIKFFNWIGNKIQFEENKRIKGIKIGNYNLFDAKRQVLALLSLNRVIKWLFILLLIYIALPILFGIFPWTEHFTDTLFGYILNPTKKIILGFWNYLPNLFTIIVIYIVFKYILKGIHFLKIEIENDKLHLAGFYPDWANPTYQILRLVLYAFMFVLIFPFLPGSNSPIFQGVSVFLGVLFTFGSSGSLSNIVAGIVLTYMRLFKIGDRVKIGDVVGDVIEKSMLVTRIKTVKNEVISIPNTTVMSSHTINYSNEAEAGNGLILHTTVTIGYDIPWKIMHQVLLDASDRTDLLLKEPKPFVLQTSLDDFYVSYQINAYTREANKQSGIYSQLHANIQDCCNEAGIEILSPHYRQMRDGNRVTIPNDYLDKDYQAPSFNVKITKED
ncbi:mechanosensitive ion channel family protein [Flavobacterium psychrophilum]|uniref:mechanosensitive ion channel family protein n=1 Tax=Flavobacterium psychrophilum TaxID=96345 RepID=UPI00106BCFEA|nr:mechanosensitive ion channel domain-containing protein [Flavobacterium psychrophilum]